MDGYFCMKRMNWDFRSDEGIESVMAVTMGLGILVQAIGLSILAK